MIQLPQEMIDRLDARATMEGRSRAAVIREAIAALLDGGEDKAIRTAYEEGYRTIPADHPDEWGDPAAFRGALREARATTSDTW